MARPASSKNKDSNTRVFNIDSSILIPDKYIETTEQILAFGKPYDSEFLSGIDIVQGCTSFGKHSLPLSLSKGLPSTAELSKVANMMLVFLKTLPIVSRSLRSSSCPLGTYTSGLRLITLYPEAIDEECRSSHCDPEFLTVLVLIHELAHAFMDNGNYAGHSAGNRVQYESYHHDFHGETEFTTTTMYGLNCECQKLPEVRTVKKDMNFYTAREESLANLVAYSVITAYRRGNNNRVKNLTDAFMRSFMEGQSEHYRFALTLISHSGMVHCRKYVECWMAAKESSTPIQKDEAIEWMKLAGKFMDDGSVAKEFEDHETEIGLLKLCNK